MVRVSARLRAFAGLLFRSRAAVAASGVVMNGVQVVFGIWLVALWLVASLYSVQVALWLIAAVGIVPIVEVLIVCAQKLVALAMLIIAVVVATVVKVWGDITSWAAGRLFPFAVLVRLLLASIKQVA